jgi:hypothetical protein
VSGGRSHRGRAREQATEGRIPISHPTRRTCPPRPGAAAPRVRAGAVPTRVGYRGQDRSFSFAGARACL